MSTNKRLSQVFNSSEELLFDNTSKFILFSDCHRGNNSWADDFARNQSLFFTALRHYYMEGYTYIEIGDGDELWENNSFSHIRNAHSDVFWLMKKFHDSNRLCMIWGNHDLNKKCSKYVEKNFYRYYNERKGQYEPLFNSIKFHEGLILRYLDTEKRIFLVHGHQGDLMNDYLWKLSRFLVMYILKPLELIGFKSPISPAENNRKKGKVEKKIINWVKSNNQIIITGHTHRPMFPEPGQPPYFNTGSCVHPRCITGIEILNGCIMLIKWCFKTKLDGTLYAGKDIIAGPIELLPLFYKEPSSDSLLSPKL
jgi:UDP-2,3-diacylglucosamine pyrophosphatase LpxH